MGGDAGKWCQVLVSFVPFAVAPRAGRTHGYLAWTSWKRPHRGGMKAMQGMNAFSYRDIYLKITINLYRFGFMPLHAFMRRDN